MALTTGSITIEDYNNEKSVMTFSLQDVDALASNFGSITQDADEVKDAILPLTLGAVRQVTVSAQYPESAAAVTDKQAAREAKWLVTYKDTTQYLGAANTVPNPGFGKLFSFEIPCANRSLLTDNKDELDLDDGPGATAKAALEPNIRSPFNRSAAVTPTNQIVSIRFVGRNT